VVTLPPLRVRDGDVPVLADHFGRRMASELDWPHWPGFSATAADVLVQHDWPGNVRELRNVVERAVYRWDDSERPIDEIEFDPFASPWLQHKAKPASAPPQPAAAEVSPVPGREPAPVSLSMEECVDFRASVEAFERHLLQQAMQRARFNQRLAAKAIGLSYDQLRHALRRHALLG
jgi:psp operon transcriptional activator